MDILGSLVVGLSSGGLFAAFGVLLTLMAALTRVINFSQVAVGVFGAFLSLHILPTGAGATPQWATVLIAVLAGAALSAGLGWIVSTWLSESSTTARSAVTVGALLGLMAVSDIFFGTRPQPLRPLLIGPLLQFESIAITKVGVLMYVIAFGVAALAWVLLAKTPLGVRLRAISDRPTAAELQGINVTALQIVVWAATGALSGLFIAIVGNAQAANSSAMIVILIPAAAAALVGAFHSTWLAIAGGAIVGGAQGLMTAFPSVALLKDWVPIVIIVLFLLWNQRKEVWDAAR